MNAILFRLFKINGSFFDVLDYYLFARSVGKDVKLVMMLTQNFMGPEQVYEQIEGRYKTDQIPEWKENIVWLKGHWKIPSMKFNNVVVMDYFTTNILQYTKAKYHIVYEHTEKKIEDAAFHIVYDHDEYYIDRYKEYKERKDCILYNEMPFGIGDIHYKLKIPIDLYKIPIVKECEKRCYINCSGKGIDEIERALELTDMDILLTGTDYITTDSRIKIVREAPKDFFNMWTTYMYIHDGKYFEPRCRLLLESLMMNKKIIYDNKYDVRDGSWYRWQEIKRRKKLPKDRILTKDDPIIQIL